MFIVFLKDFDLWTGGDLKGLIEEVRKLWD